MPKSLPDNAHVEARKISFCPNLSDLTTSQLIVQCHRCQRYFAACCQHKSFGADLYDPEKKTCHLTRLVFTDGACSNNGRVKARAGLGISIGGEDPSGESDYNWSIPVNDLVDCDAPRTSQRAELLAALEGLKRLEEAYQLGDTFSDEEEDLSAVARGHGKGIRKVQERATYVVVTDSEYVVKGVTEWFPSWRRRGWRTSAGNEPANLDLFQKLDKYVTKLEKDNVVVGFWHVPRAFNHRADALAKRAASV